MSLRKCNRCGVTKEQTTDFAYKGRLKSGGKAYRPYCKICQSEVGKMDRKAAREKLIAETGYHVRDWENVKKRMSTSMKERWAKQKAGVNMGFKPKLYDEDAVDFKPWLREYKRSLCCKDCGMSFAEFPCCLDFHHRNPGSKDFELSKVGRKRVSKKALAKIQEEIAKCDPLCANCHRKRHSLEKSTYELSKVPDHL